MINTCAHVPHMLNAYAYALLRPNQLKCQQTSLYLFILQKPMRNMEISLRTKRHTLSHNYFDIHIHMVMDIFDAQILSM